jgi:DNA-nicking Smr family endonuclease
MPGHHITRIQKQIRVIREIRGYYWTMPKPPPDPNNPIDDQDLFQQEMGDVKPLNHNQAFVKRAQTQNARVPQNDMEDSQVESGEVLRFLRSGIQSTVLQKLRRGQYPVEATLDLHGLTTAEANDHLYRFMQHSQSLGRQTVRVVHGKGHGSKGQQPILKTKINQWLREFPVVLAFCSSSPRDGGTGAVDVLLRK